MTCDAHYYLVYYYKKFKYIIIQIKLLRIVFFNDLNFSNLSILYCFNNNY